MRLLIRTAVLLSPVVIFTNGPAWAAAGVESLAIGDRAPDFELPGVDGRQYSLTDFADAKLLVIIFTCNHCPTAQAYESRILQLHADYKDRGVALVAINPNDDRALRLDELGYTDVGDSLSDMKVRAAERGFKFTINRMFRKRKFKLVTISMDEPDEDKAVLKELTANHVSATNFHLAIADRDRFANLLDREWDGPVPYTLLIAPGGKVVYRKSGEIDPLAVKRAVVEVLGRTYASRSD